VLCHQCGSPVSSDESTCSNCGANLERASRKLELRTDGLRRMTQQLRAIDADGRLFPPSEVISDRFELGERIGKGPFGEVYRAVDELIDAEVALKVFDSKLIENPRHQEQFLRTTRVARTMTQANVVRIHGSGVHKDHPWVSMQALEGLSLHKVLQMRRAKGETFSLSEIEPIVSQITLAIQHVNREFPCGNLKPQNIVFLPELLKITDHYLWAAIDGAIFANRLADSPYLAPELHTPSEDVDARCDVYSLGMIIGQMSFGADYTPGSQQAAGPEMAAIDALCRRATAFDPAERYASVEALSEDFATLVDTGSLLHPRGGRSAGLAEVSEPPPPPGASSADPLMEETPDDIAEPLEDDIATREYGRDAEEGEGDLGDLLETNEVRRDELPPPPRDAGEKSKDEATATAVRPGPSKKTGSARPDRDGDGLPTPLVVLGAVALLALAVGVFYFGAPKQGKHVEIGDSNDAASQTVASQADAADEESEDGKDGEEQSASGPEVAAATEQAGQTLLAAHGAAHTALADADEEGDEDDEDEEDDDEADEEETAEASAEASSAASGARASRGSGSRNQGKAASNSSTKEKPSQGTDCKGGMVLVRSRKGNYCIDAYEYPGRGAKPKTHVSWFEAKQLCESKGKRLCELSEWRGACGGKYPYGSSWDPNRCNTVDEDEFDRDLAAAGSLKSCRSRSGAYDMVGNVHEWVAEQRIAGGGFDSGPEVASCRYSSAKAAGSSGSNIGFRCCDRAR
jgi:eukaryotic-like serine/threonine-protein kinase